MPPASPLRIPTRLVLPLFLGGLLLRLAALPLPGTVDTKAWKAWTTSAEVGGLASVYGPPDREILEAARAAGVGVLGLPWLHPFPRAAFFYRGEYQIVDYPPLSMIILDLAGKAYRLFAREMTNGPLFNAFINLPPLLASLGLAWLLLRTAPGALGRDRALAFWVNPAMLLAAILGYQDPVFGVCALTACLALGEGRMVLGTTLVVLAGLLKPQGSLLLPTLLALLLLETGFRTVVRAALGGLLAAALVFAPWWITGHLLSALDGSRRPLEELTVSAQSLNLGWIAGYVLQWIHERPFPLARILTLETFEGWAGWSALLPSRVLLLGGTLLNVVLLLRGRRGDPVRVPLSLVLQAHLYALAGTAVHENHTFLAVLVAPLLLGVEGRGKAILGMTSAFLFLNLFLLEGVGRGLIPDRRLYHLRLATGVDLSVLVALGHVALVVLLFAWAASRGRVSPSR